ncbi:MAG: GNAT family N-acetyltransferase, partial [bacterium]|nr:GNAT family N-acetyltransferase [bacterium]
YNLYCIECENQKVYIPVFFNDYICELGVYMRWIDAYIFENFSSYLFQSYKRLQEIHVLHTLTYIPSLPMGPHWHIDLPQTIEEFDAQLSGKERQHARYYAKKLLTEVGNICFEKIEKEMISQDIVDLYLSWKKISHDFSYDPNLYLKDFGVSNAYLLKTGSKIIAIGFDSETNKENVYFENFAYDLEYSKYSIGMVLYHNIIESWINNHKKKAYLLGGDYEYKKRYNGICTMTYSGSIYRHPELVSRIEKIAKLLKTIPFYKVRKFLAKSYGFVFLPKYYKKLLLQKI